MVILHPNTEISHGKLSLSNVVTLLYVGTYLCVRYRYVFHSNFEYILPNFSTFGDHHSCLFFAKSKTEFIFFFAKKWQAQKVLKMSISEKS